MILAEAGTWEQLRGPRLAQCLPRR